LDCIAIILSHGSIRQLVQANVVNALTYLRFVTVIYVNMGEKDMYKGTGISRENREVFYASGVDRLARFVDRHPREIRVSLFYRSLLALNFLHIPLLSLTPRIRRSE